jgi:hypothetical protein
MQRIIGVAEAAGLEQQSFQGNDRSAPLMLFRKRRYARAHCYLMNQDGRTY